MQAFRVIEVVVYLIAYTVNDYGGVIAILYHNIVRVFFPPVIEIEVIAVFGTAFFGIPGIKAFVHDEKAFLIAEVKEFGGHGIVRGADSIYAKRFQQFQPALPNTERNGGAYCSP